MDEMRAEDDGQSGYVPSCFEKAEPVRSLGSAAPRPPSQGTGPSSSTAYAPEEVINRITERLGERIREELTEEIRREQLTAEQEKALIAQRVDDLMQADVSSNTCMVCYELMVPPEQAPMLLFPCGHTFCAKCLRNHMEVHGKKSCPYCRTVITSKAINHSLQQMITQFVEKKQKLELEGGAGLPPSERSAAVGDPASGRRLSSGGGVDETAAQYVSEYRAKTMRMEVLENEKADAVHQRSAWQTKVNAAQTVLGHLSTTEWEVLEKIRRLEGELALVKQHATMQQAKMEEGQREVEAARAQEEMLNRTLEPLMQECDKIKLLYEHHEGRPLEP